MLSTKSYHFFNVHKLYSKHTFFVLRHRLPALIARQPNGLRCLATPSGSGQRKAVKVSYVEDEPRMTHMQRLKTVIQNYGSTAVVLHIVYSLTSLGSFYCLIYFGVDIPSYIDMQRFGDTAAKLMTGGGTFAVAYALHKMIMPLRVGLTITTTPFVVAKLRKMGIIKKPHKPI